MLSLYLSLIQEMEYYTIMIPLQVIIRYIKIIEAIRANIEIVI